VLLKNISWHNRSKSSLPVRAVLFTFAVILLPVIFVLLVIAGVLASFVFGFLVVFVRLSKYFRPSSKKDNEGRKNVRIKR